MGSGSRSASRCLRYSASIYLSELRVGVLHAHQVDRARAGVQVIEEAVGAAVLLELADRRIGEIQVAEHDRLRRAGLRAGGDDVGVGDALPLDSPLDPRPLDPLHAI